MNLSIKDFCVASVGGIKYEFDGHTWQSNGLKNIVLTLVDGVARGISSIRVVGSNTTRVADNWSDVQTSNVYYNYGTWSTSDSINDIGTIQILSNGTICSQQTCTAFDKPTGVELRIEWRSTITGDWGSWGEDTIASIIAGGAHSPPSLVIRYTDNYRSTINGAKSSSSNTIFVYKGTFPSAPSEKTVDYFIIQGADANALSDFNPTDFIEPAEASVSIIWNSTFSAG